jgi:hypothetical protein
MFIAPRYIASAIAPILRSATTGDHRMCIIAEAEGSVEQDADRGFLDRGLRRCRRCGGWHTQRKRCPADAAAAAAVAAAAMAMPAASPATGATPAGAAAPRSSARVRYVHSPRGAPIPRGPRRLDSTPAWAVLGSWVTGVVCTTVLLICVIVAAMFIFSLPEAEQDAGNAVIGAFAATLIGFVAGMLPLYVFARPYAKVVFSILSVVLITGGLAMLVAAPVVRQMNTPHLIEYRGSNALYLFGIITVTLGCALAALCVSWSLRPRARRRLMRWARLLGAAYGVLLALSGIGLMLFMLTLINGEAAVAADGTESSVVEQSIAFAAMASFSLVPGLILTYHGISASMGDGSRESRLPLPLLVAGAYVLVLLAGGWNMLRESPLALPMPLLHMLAAALPGIALSAMAARGSPWRGLAVRFVTWRQLLLSAAISMTVAISIAVYVESIGALYAVVLLMVHNGAFEFAQNADDVFATLEDAAVILTDNEQFIAGFIAAAVLAPVVEELAKSLGPRFMMRHNTTRAQMFLLGASAGAAFGFLEAMLYGLSVIAEDLGAWWWIMLLRGGSTSLHVICTGMAGVGWWYWSIARRHGVAAALMAGAIAIHALWNGFFTVLSSRIFGLGTIEGRTLEIIAYAVVTVVSAAMVVSVPLVARRLREPPPPPVAGTPLSGMTPLVAY